MKIVSLQEGESYQPEPGWKRISLAGSKNMSVEYFEKPVGHSSPLHAHSSEQISIVLKGKMRVVNGDGEQAVLGEGDSAWFAPNESHRIENAGTEPAVGIDVFSPARAFDFWANKSQE